MRANVEDYKKAARRFLPAFAYGYLEGGSEDEVTMRRNRRVFEDIVFSPRTMVDVGSVSLQCEMAGTAAAWPAVVGPTGLNGLFRHDADVALARQAHRAGLPFTLSTASTSLLERVREATAGELWLQLYVQRERRIAESMMARARACGFTTLLLTVDTPVTGQRDHYLRTGFTLPVRWTPRLLADLARHPRWVARVGRHGMPQLVNLSRSAGMGPDLAQQAAAMSREMDTALRWEDLAWIRRHWAGKVLVKGIQSVEDARRARQYGADGVVLSNHGGRQLDGAPSAIDILPHAVAELPRGFEILVDGGIRRGSDIAKAVALGARGVLLGRAPLYGLAADGEPGCAEVLALLRKELEICMRLLGCTDIRQLDRRFLAPPAGQAGPAPCIAA
ncbi:FMN-dependent dehydrogenase [Bordetella ansorpii]|uniref:FMN-dependent dehydrogenase n=1 Tax=Bordetella ansorpii TaxID=288768 RepID=A0A157LWX3_9BORD|nr:alpha-hydroxy acid oxidase [Bordetella ansorpii]SAI01261.1 FMN-dependent dehydrogenase [Bordetella ansorpii]